MNNLKEISDLNQRSCFYYFEQYLSREQSIKVVAGVVLGNINANGILVGSVILQFGHPSEALVFIGKTNFFVDRVSEITLENVETIREYLNVRYPNLDPKDVIDRNFNDIEEYLTKINETKVD